jgi:uncharacterized protein (UPF0212 family)
MKCPYCGYKSVKTGSRKCPKCGKYLISVMPYKKRNKP